MSFYIMKLDTWEGIFWSKVFIVTYVSALVKKQYLRDEYSGTN